MITVDGYNLNYNTDHLLTSKPQTYDGMIDRLESIGCKLFYNIISSPDCNYEKNFSKGRLKESYRQMDSESRFRNIFSKKVIYANPKGYFVNKLKRKPRDCEDIKSVSFTFCEHTKLAKHLDRRGSDYGICFFHDFLQDRGVRPVTYLNNKDQMSKNRLIFNSPHLIEVYSEKYDMRWEEEWRIKSDLHFTEKDIAFVIVPPDQFNFYSGWFQEQEDFQTIQIISSNAFRSVIDFLINYPQQKNNSWDQIEVFRSDNLSGFKLSPEDFNGLTSKERQCFEQNNYKELQLFAKNIILSNYEFAYTSKFNSFESLLLDSGNLNHLFPGWNKIVENSKEPHDAERDLVMGLFGKLFSAFPFDIED